MRDLIFNITAEARRDASVKRAVGGAVRLRNERVEFLTPSGAICPPAP